MASIGGNIGTPSDGFYLFVEFYYSQSTEGNYSTITSIASKVTKNKSTYKPYNLTGKTATLKIEYLNESGSWVTAANLSDSSGYDMRSVSTITLVSGSNIKIPHKSNGKQTLRITAYVNGNLSNYYPNGQIVKSVDLTDIPRATTPSLEPVTVEMGKTIAISLPRAVSTFTHTLQHDFWDGSWTTFAESVGTSATLSVPVSWASRIPNAESGAGRIRCLTYSGSTLIGEKIVNFTATVPDTVIPTVDKITITEAVDGLAAKFGAFIQNKSKLRVVSAASGIQGSTISSYKVEILGVSYTGSDITTDYISKSGTISIKTTVTDSRGRKGSKTVNATLLEYFTPTISDFSAFRADADGNASNKGTSLKCEFDFKIAPCGNKNNKSYSIEYKSEKNSAYTTLMTDTDYYELDSSYFKLDILAIEKAYSVRITVRDYFSEATYAYHVGSKIVPLAVYPTGKGLGVFGYPDREALQVFGESEFRDLATFSDDIKVGGQIYDASGLRVSNGDALFNGGDEANPDTTTEHLILTSRNTPAGEYFYITTYFIKGKSATVNRGQLAIPYYYNNQSKFSMYYRFCYGGVWSPWERQATVGEITAATTNKVLWSGGYYMTSGHTANLNEKISAQPHGIVLIWNQYSNGLTTSSWQRMFIPKYAITIGQGYAWDFWMGASNFGMVCGKALYIYDDHLVGADVNANTGTANGITYANNKYVLRYVIGV